MYPCSPALVSEADGTNLCMGAICPREVSMKRRVLVLLMLLGVPGVGDTYTFDATVLDLPSRTYGPARESCETPSSADVVLEPGGAGEAWETKIENATPGEGGRFFLNAGTYTTEILSIPEGALNARRQIKPNNCANVTINARIKPGSYTTLAGLTLAHLTGTTDVYSGDATVRFDEGTTTTGVIIRNNFITQDDHYGIAVFGHQTELLIQGNELRVPESATSNNIFWVSGRGTDAVFTENRIHSLGGPADLTQLWHWAGTWTISRNWYGATPTAGNHLDIKLADGTSGNVLTVLENYFDGTNHPTDNYGCVITHNAADFGFSAYTYTVHARGNYFLNCQGAVWDHRISINSPEEIADVDSRTLNFTYNVVNNQVGNLGQMTLQSNHGHFEFNTFLRGTLKIGSGSIDPTDTIVRNNIFYQTAFIGHSKIDTCSHNNYYQPTAQGSCAHSITSHPLFVDVASDWNLQPTSLARHATAEGTHMGAFSTTTVDWTSHLALHLTLDDATGTTARDATAHHRDGTLDDGARGASPRIGGKALSLDGTTAGVVTVAGELGTPPAITLAAWVKIAALPTMSGEVISIGDNVVLRVRATRVSGYYFADDRHWPQLEAPVALGTDWHHLVYTAAVGQQRLYIDGRIAAEGTSPAPIVYASLGSNTVLGGHGNADPTSRCGCTLDDVRVYSRALTPSEVAGLYGAAASPTPMVGALQ